MITLPQGADQFDNQARIVHSGIGIKGLTISNGRLADRIEIILDSLPKYQGRIKHVKKLMLQAGGAKRVVELLENAAENKGYDHLIPYCARHPRPVSLETVMIFGTVIGVAMILLRRSKPIAHVLNLRNLHLVLH
mmetsp:Transcript_19713/g.29453  ORF Transcript_19713/g.29453 Transcript_19713/m.29453 type:complete len:135 (-) Transcript_19713:8-412(-)